MESRLFCAVAHSKPVNTWSAAYCGITRSRSDVLRLESKTPFFRFEAGGTAFRTSGRVLRSGSLGECLRRAGVQDLCQGDFPRSEARLMKGIMADQHPAHRKESRQTNKPGPQSESKQLQTCMSMVKRPNAPTQYTSTRLTLFIVGHGQTNVLFKL